MFKISSIEIDLINHIEGYLKAKVCIELNNALRITNISIYVNREEEIVINWPNTNNFKMAVYPICDKLTEYLEKEITDFYIKKEPKYIEKHREFFNKKG